MAEKYTSRKQIAFDLKEELLKDNFPRPQHVVNPRHYTKAWDEIAKFMKNNNWEHRQKSVYVSNEQLTTWHVRKFIEKMACDLPWLYKCVDKIDITDIGKEQHNIKQTLENITKALKSKVIEPGVKETETPEEAGRTMSDYQALINQKR